MLRGGEQDAIKRFFFRKKFRDRQARPFLQRQIKARDIDPDQIESVIKSVPVRVVLERGVVPRFELPAQHQVELEMNMSPRLVQSFAGMSHDAELFALGNMLSRMNRDRAEVTIEAVIFAAIEAMLDHDIPAVIGK